MELHALVVTHQRPDTLARTLAAVSRQSVRPDRWWVVDNAAQAEVEQIAASLPRCTYLPMTENMGPAGAIAAGIEAALAVAADDDWIMLVDDDDPPPTDTVVADLLSFARSLSGERGRVGGVGLVGGRYNRRRGWVDRVPDAELHGPVEVDHLGGGQYPLYRVPALRAAGGGDSSLFFGFDDLELGLRITDADWRLFVKGEIVLELRQRAGRLGLGRRSPGTARPPWRRYYSNRNLVVIARRHGSMQARFTVLLGCAIVSPLKCLATRDFSGARMALRGAIDGLRGRLGRTVEPEPKTAAG